MDSSATPQRAFFFLIAVSLSLLIYWFFLKHYLYWGLSYSGDLFMHVQISKSLFQGRGLFFDNAYAPASYIHSYFLLLALAPLTFVFGAYGFFMVHLVLLGTCCLAVLRIGRTKPELGTFQAALIIVGTILGPVGFWMFDDLPYGWHVELLYFPCGVLFACALAERSRWWIFWACCLALIKEDGAVVACAIHLLYALSVEITEADTSVRARLKSAIRRGAIVCFGWFAVFAFGLLILKLFAAPAGARQDKALHMGARLFGSTYLPAHVLQMLRETLLILTPALIPFLYRMRISILPLALVSIMPLLIINLLASFAYLPRISSFFFHGTHWPYRLGTLWALLTAASIFALAQKTPAGIGRKWPKPIGVGVIAFLLVASIASQSFLLDLYRGYDFKARILSATGAQGAAPRPVTKIAPPETRFIDCIADELPLEVPVSVSAGLLAYFHKHDWVNGSNADNAWAYPQFVLCDAPRRLPFDNGCIELWGALDPNRYHKKQFQHLLFAFPRGDKELRRFTRSCRKTAEALL